MNVMIFSARQLNLQGEQDLVNKQDMKRTRKLCALSEKGEEKASSIISGGTKGCLSRTSTDLF